MRKQKVMIPVINKTKFDAAYNRVEKKNTNGYVVNCYINEDGRVLMSTGKIPNWGRSDYLPVMVTDNEVTEYRGRLRTKVFYESYKNSVMIANSNRRWYNNGKRPAPVLQDEANAIKEKDWVTYLSKQKFAKAFAEAKKRTSANSKLYCVIDEKGQVSFDTSFRSNGGSKFRPATVCEVDAFYNQYKASIEKVNEAIHIHNLTL